MAKRRLSIAARFWLVLAVLVGAMACIGVAALVGLEQLHRGAEELQGHVETTAGKDDGRFRLEDLRNGVELYAAAAGDPARRRLLRGRVAGDIDAAGAYVRDTLSPHQLVALDTVVGLWRAGAFEGRSAARSADRAEALLAPVLAATDATAVRDLGDAVATLKRADDNYARTRAYVLAVMLAALLLGVGMVLWLVRSVVPRTRDYSRFAARVASGDAGTRLAPTGNDELAELGRTLDEMVSRQETERAYQATQQEFVDAMQVTESEDEAHHLLKRHVERSVSDSVVVVLNRNNSDDRLEARTSPPAGSDLAEALQGATPRSCLAVRFGRRHQQGGATDPLLPCQICGKVPALTTCDPLLVGGEVIGSVLVAHDTALAPQEDQRLRDSVSQAAPVLANLRNLAIAELRASTDALTGLPNARSVRATLKRMVAQANRSELPLAALLLDLDHFKQINDTYGHGRGDEVLAASAEAMRSAVRESDFVGRYGGEEFLLLLPDTDSEGALRSAEAVRAAVGAVAVPNVDRPVTTSVGVAVLGADGIDGDTLVRAADRALYAAKSLGRNRVASAGAVPVSTPA
ncbi:MAG TPA: GGDEF domain-containing protein [Conexibacter sp.]|nr:GGDEF domain-containing protein [Conexibacter sp.]